MPSISMAISEESGGSEQATSHALLWAGYSRWLAVGGNTRASAGESMSEHIFDTLTVHVSNPLSFTHTTLYTAEHWVAKIVLKIE